MWLSVLETRRAPAIYAAAGASFAAIAARGLLVPLYAHDPLSFTPSSKGIPVRIERTGVGVTDESLHQDWSDQRS